MQNNRKIGVIGLKGLPAFGGAATVGENIINQLSNKFEFTVYSISSHTQFKSGKLNNAYQIVFNKLPLKKLNSLYYYIVSSMHALLFGKYDVVHLHHRDAAFVIPLLRIRYEVILTIHGFGTDNLSNKWQYLKPYFDLQEKYFIKFANVITTMSQADAKLISDVINKKVEYIPNGINRRIYHNENSEGYILFAAGRIVSFKNCDLFLNALINLEYQGKVIIVGDMEQSGSHAEEIRKLASRLKNVNFKGLIKDKEELFHIYHNAKLFVFPSQREAMSMVLLEVASVGTPIVASKIDGTTQIFDSDDVLYFERNNLNDLGRKIIWALENYDEMQKRAIKAQDMLRNNYQWSKIAEKYSKLYSSLL